MKSDPFIAIEGQSFSSRQDWISRAKYRLTSHPDYFNAEHDGDGKKGWRGNHFTAMCFDQRGRRCKIGADFARATRDNAYPIWWVWPDQIATLIMYREEFQRDAPQSADIAELERREEFNANCG